MHYKNYYILGKIKNGRTYKKITLLFCIFIHTINLIKSNI